jgi:hypothetical protein
MPTAQASLRAIPLSKRRTEAVSCIRKYTTESHARCHRAIDLGQGDLWLGSRLFAIRQVRRRALDVRHRLSSSREETAATSA